MTTDYHDSPFVVDPSQPHVEAQVVEVPSKTELEMTTASQSRVEYPTIDSIDQYTTVQDVILKENELQAPSILIPPMKNDPTVVDRDQYVVDREKSIHWYRWNRYVNPWFRILLIIPILYVYAMCSGILTWRAVQFQYEIQEVLKGQVPSDTDPTNVPAFNGNVLILPDLVLDFLPAQTGSDRDSWQNFADATPIIANVVMLLLMIARRDMIRFSEYVGMQMILFSCNAVAHVVTTLPSSYGLGEVCLNPDHAKFGSWVFILLTTKYCGDQVWSGHTANTLLPYIFIRRIIWDCLGWNIGWSVYSNYLHGYNDWIPKRLVLLQSMKSPAEITNLALVEPNGANELRIDMEPIPQSNPNIQMTLPADHADSDIFFYVHKSPYSNYKMLKPYNSQILLLMAALHILMFVWFALLLFAILLIRYHYTVDVVIALIVTTLVATHTPLVQFMVRWIYRPYYHNYLYSTGWATLFTPVYLKSPLNAEQVNYEERVALCGKGGIL